MTFHKIHNIRKCFLIRPLHGFRIHERRFVHAVRIFPRYSLLCPISIRHHYNHWLCFSLCYQIIQDLYSTPQFTPGILISSGPVQQIKNRVTFCPFLITSWGIYRHPTTFHPQRRARIPHLRNRPMRYFPNKIILRQSSIHKKIVHVSSYITKHIYIGGIKHTHAIHIKAISMQFGHRQSNRIAPHTILSFFHPLTSCHFYLSQWSLLSGLFKEVCFYPYFPGLRSQQTKSHSLILYFGRNKISRIDSHSFLCPSGERENTYRYQTQKLFHSFHTLILLLRTKISKILIY